jgi:membrane-associated protease RseP (regulator of RpoE activity)
MSQENENYRAAETEVLSSDEQNVARLLSNLKRVDAPKDFDFHLKARIANASPADFRPVRLFPILKYVLPLALFLMLGAAFVAMNSSNTANVPAVAGVPSSVVQQASAEPKREITPPVPVADPAPTRDTAQVVTAVEPVEAKREFRAERIKSSLPPRTIPAAVGNFNGGGSYDVAGNEAQKPILAPGLANTNSNSGTSVTAIPLQFRQMLMSIGIDAAVAGQKTWRIMQVTEDSIAERSGLLVGDVIEAIDGKPIDPLYKGSFSVTSMKVRRGDKVVEIDLQTTRHQ